MSVKHARVAYHDPVLLMPPAIDASRLMSWNERLPPGVVTIVRAFLDREEDDEFEKKYGKRCPVVRVGRICVGRWHPKIHSTVRHSYGWTIAKRDWRYIVPGSDVLLFSTNGTRMNP